MYKCVYVSMYIYNFIIVLMGGFLFFVTYIKPFFIQTFFFQKYQIGHKSLNMKSHSKMCVKSYFCFMMHCALMLRLSGLCLFLIYNNMAHASSDDEGPTPSKVPKVLKQSDQGKRLIVVLEHASLETVKVSFYKYIYFHLFHFNNFVYE